MIYDMEKEGNGLLMQELEKYIKENYTVCEVGSGYCNFLENLVKKYKVTGIGVDPYGISKKSENLSCYNIEAEKISGLNLTFNIIYSIRSFHHITWPEMFIKESHRCLKKGGCLITVDWKWGTDTGINERYYSLAEVEEMYTDNGFKILTKINGNYNFCLTGIKE